MATKIFTVREKQSLISRDTINGPILSFINREEATDYALRLFGVLSRFEIEESLLIDEIVDYNPPEASPLTCVDAYGEVV